MCANLKLVPQMRRCAVKCATRFVGRCSLFFLILRESANTDANILYFTRFLYPVA